MNDFLKDGLRLSEGMGRKNALAGLWWGGGKGGIARKVGDEWKDQKYRDM
jgi:glutamate dehydrogenase/leucine dehydrogenase